MKMRLASVLVLAFIVSLLSGCETLEQALNLRKPDASLKGLKFGDVSLKSATLIFDVEVKNPYPVALPLVNIDYGLTSGSNKLFSGEASIESSIPARSSKVLSLPVSVSYLDIFNAFKGIKPGSKIPYKAGLGISMDTPALGILRLPLEKNGELAVPSIPNLKQIDWKTKILDTITKD